MRKRARGTEPEPKEDGGSTIGFVSSNERPKKRLRLSKDIKGILHGAAGMEMNLDDMHDHTAKEQKVEIFSTTISTARLLTRRRRLRR